MTIAQTARFLCDSWGNCPTICPRWRATWINGRMRHLTRHGSRGGTKTVPASVVLAAMLPATLAYWVVHANIAGVVLGAL